ncbi:signal peptide peptidase SppA [Candidatus Dependentiae bacterium]|nr:signal peptide peptidase SppA [Candidatus Dependentiae bacterium]
MKLRQGWTFLGILKNLFFLLLFLQVLPFFIVGIKNNIDEVVKDKIEVGYLNLRNTINDSVFYSKRIQEFEMNPSIQGLIIKVESPGGLPGSSQAIFRELSKFKHKKPVIAFIENYGTSGAYYAICGANKIIANPSAIVGSIGAVLRAPNVKDLLESWKIKHTVVQSGEYKTALDPLKAINPDEVEYLHKMTDDTYNQFVADVAHERGLNKLQHKEWANGKIFTGNQAKKLNLIDDVGSYRDAIEAMATMLKTDTSQLKLITTSRAQGLMRYLAGDDDYGAEMQASLASRIAEFGVHVYQQVVLKMGSEQPLVIS